MVDWLARYELLSVSISSNVPGYTDPQCFVNGSDPSQLVDRFLNKLNDISKKGEEIFESKYQDVFEKLNVKEKLDQIKKSHGLVNKETRKQSDEMKERTDWQPFH